MSSSLENESKDIFGDKTLFSDHSLYSDIEQIYDNITSMILNAEDGINYNELNCILNSYSAKTLAYVYRLSLNKSNFSCFGNISDLILNRCSTVIKDYLFMVNKSEVYYYRYFAQKGDFITLAKLLSVAGIEEVDNTPNEDFADFIGNLSSADINLILTNMDSGEYELIYRYLGKKNNNTTSLSHRRKKCS